MHKHPRNQSQLLSKIISGQGLLTRHFIAYLFETDIGDHKKRKTPHHESKHSKQHFSILYGS